MPTRLEIPVSVDDTLKKINLFAVDDFLRSIQSEADRQSLIRRIGFSAEKRAAYEKKHQLPRGAVEVAMMMEDKRFKQLNELLLNQLTKFNPENGNPAEVLKYYQDAHSISMGLTQLYPEARDFFLQHWLLNQRNQKNFLGDHRFSSEYRLQMISSWCPSLSPVDCNILVNLGIFLNAVAVANVAVGLNVVAAVYIFVAAALCFFGAGWPALYGPNTMSVHTRSC